VLSLSLESSLRLDWKWKYFVNQHCQKFYFEELFTKDVKSEGLLEKKNNAQVVKVIKILGR